ncbi:transposase InsO family protein [Paraburkholderia youngii]
MWAYRYKVQIDFSRPAKPTDNSFTQTFNGPFRDECLNLHWFESLAKAKRQIEAWRRDYNETRPHMALDDLTPGEFARQHSLRP